jgi:RHS repeat-associated protein
MEVNHYDPWGVEYGLSENPFGIQPFKHQGKERMNVTGFSLHNHGARLADNVMARWTTRDPLEEQDYWNSAYVYCNNNPIRYIDIDGNKPSDVFKTQQEAAKDWGKYYNGASILNKKEYFSTIYAKTKKGEIVGYSYTKAKVGEAHKVKLEIDDKKDNVAIIHSHGNDDANYADNEFSKGDIDAFEELSMDGYVATPNGSLIEYNNKTNEESVISTDMPSDPKDPDRKNTITPTDMPKQKDDKIRNVIQWVIFGPFKPLIFGL